MDWNGFLDEWWSIQNWMNERSADKTLVNHESINVWNERQNGWNVQKKTDGQNRIE